MGTINPKQSFINNYPQLQHFKVKIHFLFFPPWIKIFFFKKKNKQNYLTPSAFLLWATGILPLPLSHSQISHRFLSTSFSCMQGFRQICRSYSKHVRLAIPNTHSRFLASYLSGFLSSTPKLPPNLPSLYKGERNPQPPCIPMSQTLIRWFI